MRRLELIMNSRCPRYYKHLWRLSAAVPLALFLAMLAPCRLAAQDMNTQALQVDGVDRTYLLHLPSGYSAGKPLPLLLVFHGLDVTAELAASISGLNRWANQTGFIVIYPQGLEKRWHTSTINAASPSTGEAQAAASRNDSDFIASLIAKVEGAYSVDKNQVSVAGSSNGGEFVQELACRTDLHFRFVVSVSGPLEEHFAKNCAPTHPVRFISLHGTADPIVPYLGGQIAIPGGPKVPSVADDLLVWARINGCALDPDSVRLPDRTDDGTHVERITFKSCTPGGEVTHYRILGGGHTWPGVADQPKFLGPMTQQIDASEIIARLISSATGLEARP